jgi:hypothetical protein
MFTILTGGSFRTLQAEVNANDRVQLVRIRQNGPKVPISLRVTAVDNFIGHATPLPFIADGMRATPCLSLAIGKARWLRSMSAARSSRLMSARCLSFRSFIERMDDDAEAGQAEDAPIVDQGTEGSFIAYLHIFRVCLVACEQ